MAVLGIIGSGKATATVVKAGLEARYELIDTERDDFWFLVAYDGKPSPSLSAALKWIRTGKHYYELVVPSRAKIDDEFIDGAAKVYKASEIYTDVVTRLEADEDVDKALLVLYTQDDEAQDDAVRVAVSRDIPALDLGNALEPFEMELGEEEPDDEDEAPAKPAAASKRAAGAVPPPPAKGKPGRPRKAAAEPAEEPEAEEEEEVTTEESPEPEPPKRRTRTKAVEEANDTAAEIVATHQAEIGSDSFADMVADKVVQRLAGLLSQPF